MKPLETGEDSNLLPISNAHSDNGTFVDSNLLSSSSPKKNDGNINNSLDFIKIISFIGLLLLSGIFIYHGINKPSHIDTPLATPTMFSFENGLKKALKFVFVEGRRPSRSS